jgi:type I restriction enzyme, R subunit
MSCGWHVQDLRDLNLGESLGVAVREYPLSLGATDYLLFVDRKAVDVVEAKPVGTTLSGVAEQTFEYLSSVPIMYPMTNCH